MSSEMILHGPVVLEMKIHIVNDETGQAGVATYEMGAGEYHSPLEVQSRLETFQQQLPEYAPGFRLMTRKEFIEYLMFDRSGQRMSIAGPEAWDPLSSEEQP